MILTLFMGHIKINGINLVFKLSISLGDSTNVMQTVDTDVCARNICEVPIDSTLGGACNYCVLAYFIFKGRLKPCATLTLPRWRKNSSISRTL